MRTRVQIPTACVAQLLTNMHTCSLSAREADTGALGAGEAAGLGTLVNLRFNLRGFASEGKWGID